MLPLNPALILALTSAISTAQPKDPPPTEDPRAKDAITYAPRLITEETRAKPQALARLEKPGTVLFSDSFDSPASFKSYFEVRGADPKDKRPDGTIPASITTDPKLPHSGASCLQLTAPDSNGQSSGSAVEYWFGDRPQDRVHLRTWIRFADDYDQGNLNHTGPCLSAVAGDNKWAGMGTAGQRPIGNDHFSTRLEAWTDWGRNPPPGQLFIYSYWMDMKRDRDGNFWGNMLIPDQADRLIPQRGKWYCWEVMVIANKPGNADGEIAAWIDGKLYLHAAGIRWRSTPDVQLKRFTLLAYVHQAVRNNTVWYDDAILSTGYIGPEKVLPPPTPAIPAPVPVPAK